jgi:hypothetical protein
LQFVLDTFPVRSVANERQNGANAFDEQRALCGFCVV